MKPKRFSSLFQSSQKLSQDTKIFSWDLQVTTVPGSLHQFFLHGVALFPEVCTQFQVAATVLEEALFWEDKRLSVDITHSSPPPLTPLVCHPTLQKSGLINPPEVFQILTHYQSIN